MSIRRLIIAALLATSCETPEPSTPVSADASVASVEREPTEKQKKALANALHKAHMEADEPVECRECHRIEGRTQPTRAVKHRCLGCHEDQRSALHAKVANDAARECLSCHEFFEARVEPWGCVDCHQPVSANGRDRAPPPGAVHDGDARRAVLTSLFGVAPSVAVHEKDCQACHVPHGEQALAPKSCLECHEDQAAVHASADQRGRTSLAEPKQCMECHGGHEASRLARQKCATCHASDVPKTTTFSGHDTCLECHQPHSKSGKKACISCHAPQPTVGADEHPEHDRCLSCHRPHAVVASAQAECLGCHEDRAVPEARAHPADDTRGPCAGCHPQHPIAEVLIRVTTCTTCHEEAKTDDALHSGTCISCHQPHLFDLDAEGAKLCGSCHVGAAPLHTKATPAKIVAPVEGHDQCVECHAGADHAPEASKNAAKSSCGKCHEEQRRLVSSNHSKCLDCHAPHEGAVQQDCLDCHDDKAGVGRHQPNREDCDTCHSIHVNPPVETPPCISCHEPPLPLLHQNEGHETCADCHTFHQQTLGGDRASCLNACHETLTDHESAAKRCVGCHPFERGGSKNKKKKEAPR